jgi:CRP-like cAMP-binding protein
MTGDLARHTWQMAHSLDGDAAAREAIRTAHESEENGLLRALPFEDYARVLPHLRPARLGVRDVLLEPDAPIGQVFFLRAGVASVVAGARGGRSLEIGSIGNEGMVGMPLVHGVDRSPFGVLMQVEGEAWRLDGAVLLRLLEERPALRALLQRYAEFLVVLLGQSVACNGMHTIVERCARWILMTDDRLRGQAFELTHEFIATMLGVRRSGVTIAMGALKRGGMLAYRRTSITVIDRPRLELAACGCYALTRAARERLLG